MLTARILAGVAVAALSAFVVVAVAVRIFEYSSRHAINVQVIHYGGGK